MCSPQLPDYACHVLLTATLATKTSSAFPAAMLQYCRMGPASHAQWGAKHALPVQFARFVKLCTIWFPTAAKPAPQGAQSAPFPRDIPAQAVLTGTISIHLTA